MWISAIPFLYVMMHDAEVMYPGVELFVPLLITSYRLLGYISYNIDRLDGLTPRTDTYARGLFRQFHYAFYMPYLFTLIVLYDDWRRQMDERRKRQRDIGALVFFGARMLFWTVFIEFMLHFMYFEAIMHSPSALERLPKNQLVAVGAAIGSCNKPLPLSPDTGQFFHMKYVVIFGVPALFAKIDRLQPPDGPMCVSRVALYSKVWRMFDRGLYVWFKTYIFVPICRPTFSIPRRLLGLASAYTFVLIWHGFYHHNIVWVVLNVLELLMEQVEHSPCVHKTMEQVCKGIYAIRGVHEWRERNIGALTFRRLCCVTHMVPYAFALYSIFYFLAGSEAGAVFVERILVQETLTFRWPFMLLWLSAYVYAQVCIETELVLEKRRQLADDHKSKNE